MLILYKFSRLLVNFKFFKESVLKSLLTPQSLPFIYVVRRILTFSINQLDTYPVILLIKHTIQIQSMYSK